jgi:predicted Zn-dependent protease
MLDVAELPEQARDDLREAADRVTSASHVPFVMVTSSVDSDAILVRAETDLPAPTGRKRVGYTVMVTRESSIVRGRVSIDLSQANGYGFRTRGAVGAVLMHELGHVVGAKHSHHIEDLMFPTTTQGPPVFTAADVRQLAAAGRRLGCE